ncbi:GRAM domain family protein, putative isoform 1 [Quillaja saponaria]|uniref:GRAM domain family protein, putative isoform 1 n=1 Tax=Quillaja saponaria TaxID=32244 RepID=A0AAD7PCQ1_QUISA|nr:GRAM domain family protein, putative isoform 1 [Quillaja saponaria]
MAVASASAQRSEPSQPMDRSSSNLATDTTNNLSLSSPSATSSAIGTPDRNYHSNSSPTSRNNVEIQSPSVLRSEEYRQLFRLPTDEVLIEDFNCAFQENILIQGHMYLFVHFICFYSNIFGFETKKIIPFNEVTSVKKAKTAGIFPNAIEVVAGSRKYLFASFLSRDEALKIINDGWSQHGNSAKAIVEQQESISESTSQENEFVAIEKTKSFKGPDNETRSTDMSKNSPTSEVLGLPSIVLGDPTIEESAEPDLRETPSMTWIWKEENIDAPKIPEFFTSVAESRFPIKVEDFFKYFFSDDDCHLVIETSQEVSDVPYADYFLVEGLWDVQTDKDVLKECCILRIYVNVAFSKKTIWKGKIVQSTVEECREAYGTWIGMAHELLKQKNLEKQEEGGNSANMVQNGKVHLEREANVGESSERFLESSNATRIPRVSDSVDDNQQLWHSFARKLDRHYPCCIFVERIYDEARVMFEKSKASFIAPCYHFCLDFLDAAVQHTCAISQTPTNPHDPSSRLYK